MQKRLRKRIKNTRRNGEATGIPQDKQLAYASSLEHLCDELRRLDVLIYRCLLQMRQQGVKDGLGGLYIAEADIDALLEREAVAETQPEHAAAFSRDVQDCLVAYQQRIAARRVASQQAEVMLRLEHLREVCQLSTFDVDTLLLCLAPEIDRKYEKFYAYLQDDITRKRPSIELILTFLCPSFEANLTARQRFTTTAPLVAYELLHLWDEVASPPSSLLSKQLTVDEGIVHYLLETADLDTYLHPYAHYIQPHAYLDAYYLAPEVRQRLTVLMQQYSGSESSIVFSFQGPNGVGKCSIAKTLCQEAGRALLVVDGERVVRAGYDTFATTVHRVTREALLRDTALYWQGFDVLLADDKRFWLETLLPHLVQRRGMTFLAGEVPWEPPVSLMPVPYVSIALSLPTYSQRLQLWHQSLDNQALEDVTQSLAGLANAFHFSAGQIRDAVATAHNLARWREPGCRQIGMADLSAACRLQATPRLATLATRIVPRYSWSDIVLPAEKVQQLREICAHVKHRALVYETWGFDRKLSLGKGLNVLFAGPSGTGKTMAAEIIASDLALELYQIDLALVVSKYIGETEKNLARIFAEAATSNAILFFDEADALFGKRTEVRDAHDRYANIETSYLLQKMEAYAGIVILATNLRKNMDEAFVRRLHFSIDFPLPTAEDRRRIWGQIWPDSAPYTLEPALDVIAQRFEITGGNIRNIALAAAFLAAEDAGSITTKHLRHALRREYQKLGKIMTDKDFAGIPDARV